MKQASKTNKLQVICHMMASVDGKILTKNWSGTSLSKKTSKLYETIHKKYNSQAWMCGRVTMERDFADGLYTHKGEQIKDAKDHIADKNATSFAIAIDASGKLAWKENNIDGDHIVEILTEEVSQAYIDYLKGLGISYLFAGKTEIDLKLAIQKIKKQLLIKILMLEGGGHLNGAMMKAGLVDELSLLLLPLADGTTATTVFETGAPITMKLKNMEKLANDVLWLQYQIK